ncbi:MAG: bifunctional demethylmenaquinone methyltransferase/2-methoxy-6-polyprenyl-1,4-benzoquinol methylase UbiE [SAR324 cluster bacterium]|uniref:Demethylmenaquinone methyltransferase n=1 Tax=SAR324 cluster bacterium TaxID=2024889 RepID=A0A2A4SRM6_9DELT|nr:MAG: bifunctional demethylmenaquinone methyltransferase/2-methoxy-6-polyprenyl-1,4-benzoquinol methylase UbiE [SAR324 cluster bacterium]
MAFTIPEGDAKPHFVQSSFTRIAAKYDLFNDLITQGMHRYWKNFMVKKAKLKPGDKVLDLCCGTGDITERLEQAVGPKGTTLGLDFSAGMLQVAGARNQGQAKRSFLQGDAMVLPIRSSSMDVITVGYGLRNLRHIQPCLDEVMRVLKPGGRFLILDMGKVKLPIVKQIFQFYFFQVVPLIGKLLYKGEDMFEYFPESSVKYPSQEKMADLLRTTGFMEVEFFNFTCGATAIHYAEKPA